MNDVPDYGPCKYRPTLWYSRILHEQYTLFILQTFYNCAYCYRYERTPLLKFPSNCIKDSLLFFKWESRILHPSIISSLLSFSCLHFPSLLPSSSLNFRKQKHVSLRHHIAPSLVYISARQAIYCLILFFKQHYFPVHYNFLWNSYPVSFFATYTNIYLSPQSFICHRAVVFQNISADIILSSTVLRSINVRTKNARVRLLDQKRAEISGKPQNFQIDR